MPKERETGSTDLYYVPQHPRRGPYARLGGLNRYKITFKFHSQIMGDVMAQLWANTRGNQVEESKRQGVLEMPIEKRTTFEGSMSELKRTELGHSDGGIFTTLEMPQPGQSSQVATERSAGVDGDSAQSKNLVNESTEDNLEKSTQTVSRLYL